MAKTSTIFGTSGGYKGPATSRPISPYTANVGTTGGYQKTSGTGVDDLLKGVTAADVSAREKTEARYGEAKNIYDQMIDMFAPGGGFGEQAKKQMIASGQQSLVSSGLFGTTQAAGLGMAATGQIEGMRAGKYGEALMAKAGLLERREDEGPDYKLIASLMQQIYGA
jgi:hypothetical protein